MLSPSCPALQFALKRSMNLLKLAEIDDGTVAVDGLFGTMENVPNDDIFDGSDTVDLSTLGLKPGSSFKDFNDFFEKTKSEADSKTVVKALYFIRHGEGDHNSAEKRFGKRQWEDVEAKKEKYLDSPLNDVGKVQSQQLNGNISLAKDLKIDAIIVSPLTRAIETGSIGLSHVWGKIPTISVEVAREHIGKNYCDKRMKLSELKNKFGNVDFTLFESENDPWWTTQRETDEHIQLRVKTLLHFLSHVNKEKSILNRAEHIAIVGHSGFMSESMKVIGHKEKWPQNCEFVPVIVKFTI